MYVYGGVWLIEHPLFLVQRRGGVGSEGGEGRGGCEM